MRKVTIKALVDLTLNIDEGVDIVDVMSEIEIQKAAFHKDGCTESFEIEDARITQYDIVDSR